MFYRIKFPDFLLLKNIRAGMINLNIIFYQTFAYFAIW